MNPGLLSMALVVAIAAPASAAPQGPRPRPPNVVMVVTDDQGYGDLSCHGNPVLKTPSLDALWAESVRLTDFHVDPCCSPTRAALLTGRYASRVAIADLRRGLE
jgi:arylsulfatase A-like enzyme